MVTLGWGLTLLSLSRQVGVSDGLPAAHRSLSSSFSSALLRCHIMRNMRNKNISKTAVYHCISFTAVWKGFWNKFLNLIGWVCTSRPKSRVIAKISDIHLSGLVWHQIWPYPRSQTSICLVWLAPNLVAQPVGSWNVSGILGSDITSIPTSSVNTVGKIFSWFQKYSEVSCLKLDICL